MADLTLGISAQDDASAVFQKLGKAVLQFGADSVKAFMEAEKADARLSSSLKQLGYDAGKLTPILKAQASAFQSALGVSEEMVQSLQSLQVRYGVAPKDIKATTQAVLDYAAATGTDAEGANKQLLKAIEAGGKGLKKMGIDIKATGDKATDLNAALKVMNERFGGAADAQANTLAGQIEKMGAEFGELKESVGGLLAEIEGKLHVIATMTSAVKGLREVMSGSDAESRMNERTLLMQKIQERTTALGYAPNPETKAALEKEIAELKAKLGADTAHRQNVLTGGHTNEGPSKKSLQIGAESQADSKEKKKQEILKAQEENKKINDEYTEAAIADWVKRQDDERAMLRHLEKKKTDVILQSTQERLGAVSAASQTAADKLAAEGSAAMQATGTALGVAFAGGLQQEFTSLANGGEFDLGRAMVGMIPALVTAALMGTPAAPFAPVVGGALAALVGGLASGGGKGAKRMHSGGYVDGVPRYHSGGLAGDEEVAILQHGESVIDRDTVRANGGHAGVTSRLRGGGGVVTMNISTLDAMSFQDYLGGRGGQGFMRTIEMGRGEMAQKLRRAGVR
jgi:hypothetical protein